SAPPAPRRSVGRAHAVPHCRGSPRSMPRSRCRCVQYRQSAATALRTSAPCPVAPPSSRHTRNPPSLPAGRYTLYRPTVAPCLLFVRNFKIAGATVRPPAFPANRRRTKKKPGRGRASGLRNDYLPVLLASFFSSALAFTLPFVDLALALPFFAVLLSAFVSILVAGFAVSFGAWA